jgi:hypothetical protein
MKKHSEWALARVQHGGYLGGKEKPEHYIWRTMIARCSNPNSKDYVRYGGKGVIVCSHWHKYENFLADMGQRPSDEYSLDRIDNTKGYSKDNCRWATRSDQQKNKVATRKYTNGKFIGTLVECAVHISISKELAWWRFKQWGSFQKEILWQELQKQ